MDNFDEIENTEIENTGVEISPEEFDRQAKEAFKKAGWGMFFGSLAQVGVAFIVALIILILGKSTNDDDVLIWSDFIIKLATLLGVYQGIKNIKCDNVKKTTMPIRDLIKYLLISFPLIIAGSIIGDLVEQYIFKNKNNSVDTMFSSNFVYAVISSVIFAPIFEELIFRKLFIDRLSKFGKKSAILFSALCFAIVHGNFFQFFYALFSGLIFGYVYSCTRNITYTILWHAIINLVGGVLSSLVNINIMGGIWIVLSVIGIIVLCMNYKNIKFESNEKETSLRTMFLSSGFVLFLTVIIFLSLINTSRTSKEKIEDIKTESGVIYQVTSECEFPDFNYGE